MDILPDNPPNKGSAEYWDWNEISINPNYLFQNL